MDQPSFDGSMKLFGPQIPNADKTLSRRVAEISRPCGTKLAWVVAAQGSRTGRVSKVHVVKPRESQIARGHKQLHIRREHR